MSRSSGGQGGGVTRGALHVYLSLDDHVTNVSRVLARIF
jgi:hypothetical protein